MTAKFHDDETGYADWLNANPEGYVFNHFGGRNAADNVVHRTACPWLHTQRTGRRHTSVAKFCSNNVDDLLADVHERCGDGWQFCGTCCGHERDGRGVGRASALMRKESATRLIRSPRPQPLPPAIRAQPGPSEGEYVLWKPGDVLAVVEIEPRLASWDRKAHPAQIKLQAYLDELQHALMTSLDQPESKLCLHVEVVKPQEADLLRHYDMENFLTPIADRLRNDAIVLFSGAKRHQQSPEDRSSITIRRAEPGAVGSELKFFSIRLAGSSEAWKPAIRQALIDARIELAAAGPIDMMVAFGNARPSRWWASWKSIGDGLGPILGEPNPAKPYEPADDRIVKLAFHKSSVNDAGQSTSIGIWWRRALGRA